MGAATVRVFLLKIEYEGVPEIAGSAVLKGSAWPLWDFRRRKNIERKRRLRTALDTRRKEPGKLR